MSTVRNTNRLTLTSGACGLALLFGCATAPPSGRGHEGTSIDEPESGKHAEAPTDVFKAGPKQAQPQVSEDERTDFEKAVAVYQKLRKNGSLKGSDCDEAASAFRRVANDHPNLNIARHNEASVYMECGRKQD